jgi:hypothetical protein
MGKKPSQMKFISRVSYGIALAMLILTAVAGILLLANVEAHTDACPLIPSLPTIGCFLRNYKELAAGLLAAGSALFAAWIAWSAIQEQLRQNEQLAAARDAAAHAAVCDILREDFLGIIDAAWRAIDLALMKEQTPEKRRSRQVTAMTILSCFPDANKGLAAVDELLPSVGLIERRRLAFVVMAIRWIYDMKNARSDEEMGDPAMKLYNVRTMMSHMHRYLVAFDPAFARTFDRRTKNPVDHTPMAASLHAVIDEHERQGVHPRAAPSKETGS